MNRQNTDIATFSPCRKYRYTLWRRWTGLLDEYIPGYVNFICLNPSTADETKDDNTIRKCVKLAKSWGYGAMCVTNLFAWRATDPNAMKLANEPVGDYNDHYLMLIALNADMVIAAWSQHGNHQWRADYVRTLLERVPMKVLRMGKGKNGQPWHPLYLPDSTVPVAWNELAAMDTAEE